MKKSFGIETITLLPIAMALNFIIGQLVILFKLPIFLDSIGTILVALLSGSYAGMVAGLLSSLINGIVDPTFFPFTIVAIVIGGVSGFLAKKQMFQTPIKLAISIICITLLTSITAAPVAAYVFGGVTNSGNTLITAFLLNTGQNLFQSVFTSQIIADIVDKTISILLALSIIKAMPRRFLIKFRLGEFYFNDSQK